MLARYSNVFVVDIKANVPADSSLQVSGIGQAFELMTVLLEGEDGCSIQLSNGTVEGAIAKAGQTVVNEATSTYSAHAVIKIAVTGGAMRRCQLLCRAVDSLARPVKVELV